MTKKGRETPIIIEFLIQIPNNKIIKKKKNDIKKTVVGVSSIFMPWLSARASPRRSQSSYNHEHLFT